MEINAHKTASKVNNRRLAFSVRGQYFQLIVDCHCLAQRKSFGVIRLINSFTAFNASFSFPGKVRKYK